MRQLVDPFMGAGSTIAAAISVGYESIGIERDPNYFSMGQKAIPALAKLHLTDPLSPQRGLFEHTASQPAQGPGTDTHFKIN
ncbi:MAG: DNA methyltransferase [Candidatus Binataceae bacterium]